jgi:RNA polymerase sigma-70 factor, ECF subfamily
MSRDSAVTDLLRQIDAGDRDAVNVLVPILYEELRRIARRQLRRERPDHTLNTTALVHEAYMKLVGLDRIAFKNRGHFLALAAQAMRRVLVDYAVTRKTAKRGGDRHRVTLDESLEQGGHPVDRLIAIDRLLDRLDELNPRLARIVECRVFGGMTVDETAQATEVSPATVKRDWSLACAWLTRELGV